MVTASLLLVGVVPASAQTHPGSHDPASHHAMPGHVRPDSAHHAAMHALVNGTWRGDLASAEGTSTEFALTIAHDSLSGMTLRAGPDLSAPAALIRDLTMHGMRLRWTQALVGESCKASAAFVAATPVDPATIKGTMACADGERTFVLRKTTD